MSDEDTTVKVHVILICTNQDLAARAIETLSRPITGLVLEGVKVLVTKED